MLVTKQTFVKAFPFLLAIVVCIVALPPLAVAQSKLVVGWIEKVRIYPGNLMIHAKVDTGAKHSSLNASNVTEFRRDGKRWVRFDVINRRGEKATIERRVYRVADIRSDGGVEKRLVVHLDICLGNVYRRAEVNLNNRKGFKYQMLIGRSFMKDKIIVDPCIQYKTKPNCKEVPEH